MLIFLLPPNLSAVEAVQRARLLGVSSDGRQLKLAVETATGLREEEHELADIVRLPPQIQLGDWLELELAEATGRVRVVRPARSLSVDRTGVRSRLARLRDSHQGAATFSGRGSSRGGGH